MLREELREEGPERIGNEQMLEEMIPQVQALTNAINAAIREASKDDLNRMNGVFQMLLSGQIELADLIMEQQRAIIVMAARGYGELFLNRLRQIIEDDKGAAN